MPSIPLPYVLLLILAAVIFTVAAEHKVFWWIAGGIRQQRDDLAIRVEQLRQDYKTVVRSHDVSVTAAAAEKLERLRIEYPDLVAVLLGDQFMVTGGFGHQFGINTGLHGDTDRGIDIPEGFEAMTMLDLINSLLPVPVAATWRQDAGGTGSYGPFHVGENPHDNVMAVELLEGFGE